MYFPICTQILHMEHLTMKENVCQLQISRRQTVEPQMGYPLTRYQIMAGVNYHIYH